jgi:hypothetical protein
MSQIDDVGQFIREVVQLPCPDVPTMMGPDRKAWFLTAMGEEVQEFADAETVEDQIDACLDMAYFALGRVFELGAYDPQAHWDEVQRANMAKRRGSLSKRPGSLGHDAVKPEGWRGPDHSAILRRGPPRKSVRDLYLEMERRHKPRVLGRKPRVLILGHARHGKDTVAEMLAERYGLRLKSSSMIAAEQIIMPSVASLGLPAYQTAEECFDDRVNHRALWYDEIVRYNAEDPTRLARLLYSEADIYVGLRARREWAACQLAQVYDFAVWVDASDRHSPEGRESCTVEPWMADYHLDNNGDLTALSRQVDALAARLGLMGRAR